MIDIHQLRHYVKAMNRARKSLALSPVLAALLALALISSGAWAGALADANPDNPGQTLEINSLLVKGKTTVIDFYSPFCPPCVRLAPLMAKLAKSARIWPLRKSTSTGRESTGLTGARPWPSSIRSGRCRFS